MTRRSLSIAAIIATLVLCALSAPSYAPAARTWPHADRRTSFNHLRIYQVMVEAFADGDPQRGYETGWGPSHHRGDLRGITDALPYIAGLGVNAIWLTPIFDSDRHAEEDDRLDATGYFARNYFRIDPEFGSLEDAHQLVDRAHELGLFVLLDGVFGHHKGDVAPSPSGLLPAGPSNPVDYPASLDFYTEVATYWIDELGIDGWRLDQAYQVPPEAWRHIRATVEGRCRERALAGQEWGTLGYMVAEVWRGEDEIAAAAYGPSEAPALLSAFDFPLRYRIVQALAVEESGKGRLPARVLAEGFAGHAAYPEHAAPNLMLTNHDLVRLGDLVERAGYGGRDTAQYWARLRAAHSFQAAYTGPITLYYGEEIGEEVPGFAARLEEGCAEVMRCDDHVSRTSGRITALDARERQLRAYVQRLLRLRAAHPALWNGARRNLVAGDAVYADLKTAGDDRVLYVLNVSPRPQRVGFDVASLGAARLVDALSSTVVEAVGDSLTVELGALEGRFLEAGD